MGISERYTTERNKEASKKVEGDPFMITEVHQEGRFYRLSTGRAAHYENIKHTQSIDRRLVYTCRHGRRGII